MTKAKWARETKTTEQPAADSRLTVAAQSMWSFIVRGIPILAGASIISSLIKANSDSKLIVEVADRFILNREFSIPTIISFVLLMLAGQLSLVNYFHYRRIKRSVLNVYWIFVALLFLFLAYDEVAQLHEQFRSMTFGGLLHDQSWVFVGVPFVVVIGLILGPFLLAEPRGLKVAFIKGGALFVLGAIGFEVIGGVWLLNSGSETVYMLLTVIEETLELAGLSYVNYALLKHAADQRVRIDFS